MSGESLLWFLVIGLAAGWLATRVTGVGGYGLIGDLVVGVIGAVLGGWLFGLLGIRVGGLPGALITAFFGAVVLILLLRLIQHGRAGFPAGRWWRGRSRL